MAAQGSRCGSFKAVDRAMADIGERPEGFVVVDTSRGIELRRVVVRGFPYQLVYGALNGELIVFAVAHLHRRPGYWRARLGRG
jgi:hypothetical protein